MSLSPQQQTAYDKIFITAVVAVAFIGRHFRSTDGEPCSYVDIPAASHFIPGGFTPLFPLTPSSFFNQFEHLITQKCTDARKHAQSSFLVAGTYAYTKGK